ncbi:hypothetical protein F4804DRAFT_241935 [Jackrogersella minutella]|nr:hypothetical protein F4804DRAFT_241935 [Jackrogersella minutella]
MKQLEISCFLVFGQLWAFCIASFQNEFKNVIHESNLLLQWDSINATDYPLVIHSKFINQTSEYGANSLEVIIAIGLNDSSFLWKGVPYPLPYLNTAKYEVEVWSQNRAESKVSSPYFTISGSEGDDGTDESGNSFSGTIPIIPSKPTNQPVSTGGINNNTAIAAGLVVPVVAMLAIFGFVWMQQRQKRIIEEKRKQREELYID